MLFLSFDPRYSFFRQDVDRFHEAVKAYALGSDSGEEKDGLGRIKGESRDLGDGKPALRRRAVRDDSELKSGSWRIA